MLKKHALATDTQPLERPANRAEYERTRAWVAKKLEVLAPGEKLELQTLYTDKFQPGDIHLYIAFHELILEGKAKGLSPYEEGHNNHKTMVIEKLVPTNFIQIRQQDYRAMERQGIRPFNGEWELPRKIAHLYLTDLSAFAAANEAFETHNLTPEDLPVTLHHKCPQKPGPSLSVGDIVEVHPIDGGPATAYLCDNFGWKTKEIPNITKNPPVVNFLGEECTIQLGAYPNGRTAIQLWSEEGPMAKATVNVPNFQLPPKHILIKNYSENAPGGGHDDMATSIEKAGIAQKIGEHDGIIEMKLIHPWILNQLSKEKAKAKTPPSPQGPEM